MFTSSRITPFTYLNFFRMHPGYKKLQIEPDDAVLAGGCVHLDPALDFLDNAASKESLENNVVLQ